MKALVTFASVHHAIKAEQVLQQLGCGYTLLPTPRELSVSCGIACLLPRDRLQEILRNFAQHHISYSRIYDRTPEGYCEIIMDSRETDNN